MAPGLSSCTWWRQFLLMLWKNSILQVRRPLGTIVEILLPAAVLSVYVIIRYTEFKHTEHCFATFPVLPVNEIRYKSVVFYYSPNTSATTDVMSRVRRVPMFVSVPELHFIGVNSEKEIIERIGSSNLSLNHDVYFPDLHIYGGIVFPPHLHHEDDDIVVTIREKQEVNILHTWHTSSQQEDNTVFYPKEYRTYFNYGFLSIQSALATAITEWKLESNGVKVNPDMIPRIRTKEIDKTLDLGYIRVAGLHRECKPAVLFEPPNFRPRTMTHEMPFPKYIVDFFLEETALVLPILIVIGYLFSAGMFTKELVLEKESRLRESMKMMGLKPSALFSAWFVKQFLFLLLTALLVSGLLKIGIFVKSDFSVILVFVIFFTFSHIGFGFFMSSLFTSARISLYVSFIVWFLLVLPYNTLAARYDVLPLAVILASCLFSNTCAGFGLMVFTERELQGDGVTWNNAFEPLTTEDSFHLGVVFGMFLLDTVLYLVFSWYKEAVFPGKYGVPKPFYFPFLPSYWLGRPLRKAVVAPFVNETELQDGNDGLISDMGEGGKCTASMVSLTKVYKRCCRARTLAVDNLSLNMYEGQITALLGHNGAGKTTTMSVLTGLYTPTSGDAVINGYSILTDMDEIRKNLGLCPQHNVLFERLTVKEHLMLFGILKGMRGKSLCNDVRLMIADLQLDDKRNVAVKKLSGGMKRKLSVGIALIGGSKFVILDEPTSGMDPYARRSTWDLLGKYKKNRTILLTTHHMDEADILGDRIAIMAEGKLLTSGSSFFLKSRFGVGYHLTMVKGRDASSERICEVVMSTIDGAEKVGDVAGELSFVLPSHLIDHYPKLFDKLEANKETLGIISYGVSAPTIQDVFLRIMNAFESDQFDVESGQIVDNASEDSSLDTPVLAASSADLLEGAALNKESSPHYSNSDVNTGVKLWIQQFRAMIVKRALNTFRNLGALASQFLLPFVVAILGFTSLKSSTFPINDPPRQLTLKESSPYTGIKMFYADFEDAAAGPHDVLKTLDASLLQVSSFLNITEGVNIIRQEVVAHNNSALCCDYNQQLLDNYCLSINSSVYFDELKNCTQNRNFGFRRCLSCLDIHFQDMYGDCGFRRPNPTQPVHYGPVKALNTYIDEYLLRFGAKNMQEYIRHYQLGFTAERDPSSGSSVFTVWYSSQFYHICPSALSAFHNTYMNYLLTRYNVSRSTSSVTFVNHPLPRTQEGLVAPVVASLSGLTLATYLSFALSLVLSGFVLFIVQERASKAKHLQFVSGVRNSIYWMANLIWDCGICVVNIAVICIIVGGFRVEEFSDQNFLALFTLLVLFCWSGLSLVYTASSFFTCHLFAFASMMVTLSVNPIMVTIKKAVKYVDPDTAQSMHRWFLMHPSYAFSDGLGKLYINGVVKKICDVNSTLVRKECAKNGIEFVDSVFTMSEVGIGEQLVALATVGAVLWAIFLIVANSKYLKAIVRKFACKIRSLSKDNEDEDDDVVEERDRVKAMKILDCRDVVTIEEVTKVYHSCHKRSSKTCRKRVTTAVNNISVGIGGECFGLLGNNGAGKTTTFKILTGDLNATSGTAFIAGDDIRKNTKGAQQHLGYCPQFDALLERMTGEELLTMFCRLRGIPEKKIPHVVKTEIKRLDLEKYAKKRCGTYSGGNKRKLSAALSLVGDPPVVLLDEPTSGMDPKSRRKVWEVLSSAVSQGRSVVLCSHSMEECEALCTRLAIMVNGEFKCLGSVQHLKNKFGKGYTVSLCMKQGLYDRSEEEYPPHLNHTDSSDDDCPMLDAMPSSLNGMPPAMSLSSFRECLKRTMGMAITFNFVNKKYVSLTLPSNSLSWSEIFRKLEEHKEYLGIEDYSVSQTTLEQVFLDMVKYGN